MEKKPGLDDFVLFLAVADAGGLSGAAQSTGTSVPTLSRRMTDLERRTGRRLFQRGNHGYALTSHGRQLRDDLGDLRTLSARLGRWSAEGQTAPWVRITAGHWTARYLARRIADIWTREARWVPEFVASNVRVDIARREADIGIRNRRPDQTWLAGRRTATITYAIYGTSAAVDGYLSLSAGEANPPSNRWLRATYGDQIVTAANTMQIALDLALGGIGRIVLPCFAGDAEPGLIRLSDPIDELTHEEWLVSHHDARHDPPIRAALDAIAEVLTAEDRAPGA